MIPRVPSLGSQAARGCQDCIEPARERERSGRSVLVSGRHDFLCSGEWEVGGGERERRKADGQAGGLRGLLPPVLPAHLVDAGRQAGPSIAQSRCPWC